MATVTNEIKAGPFIEMPLSINNDLEKSTAKGGAVDSHICSAKPRPTVGLDAGEVEESIVVMGISTSVGSSDGPRLTLVSISLVMDELELDTLAAVQ